MRNFIIAAALTIAVSAPAVAASPVGLVQINGTGYGANLTVAHLGPVSFDPFVAERSNGQLRDFSLREGAGLNINVGRFQIGVASTLNKGLRPSSPTFAAGFKL